MAIPPFIVNLLPTNLVRAFLAAMFFNVLIAMILLLVKSSQEFFQEEVPKIAQFFQEEVPKIRDELFHSPEEFKRNYHQMERDFKVFVYPIESRDSTCYKLAGKDVTEAYFLKNIKNSPFVTKNHTKANLFFVPLPCGIWQIQGGSADSRGTVTFEDHLESLILRYPYWNRTLGADHFFVTCHGIRFRDAERFSHLLKNSIRVVCSSSYGNAEHMPYEDPSLVAVMPPSMLVDTEDKNRDRKRDLLMIRENDMHRHPNKQQLYRAKYCVSSGMFDTFRAIHHGCIPVIRTAYFHHNSPFKDILDWEQFSIVVDENRLEWLDEFLKGLPDKEYRSLSKNTVKVKKHFQWNSPPKRLDAFHMVMYELWLHIVIVVEHSSLNENQNEKPLWHYDTTI